MMSPYSQGIATMWFSTGLPFCRGLTMIALGGAFGGRIAPGPVGPVLCALELAPAEADESEFEDELGAGSL